MIKNTRAFLLGTACCFALNTASSESLQQPKSSEFVLSSTQMSDGGNLPIAYTCDGKKVSPPLSWHLLNLTLKKPKN